MAEAQPQPHKFLRSLFRCIEYFEPDFPSPEYLYALGIQAFEVLLDPDKCGTFQFSPSFFQPHPDRLLQLYPPRPDVQEQEEFLRLSPIPSVQDIMNDSDIDYSPEVAPTFANLHRYDINRYEMVNDALAQARQTEKIIDCHMTIPRNIGAHIKKMAILLS
ncbi:hypothetical protein CBS147333_9600 [Penicillium roqueforti]|nr:hypothetical protein CBS147332_783 [Penicillium roqueforti]KAI3096247.1 hypothetical protein CBS147333_9600 [Penicillium roqueforti]KAI3105962.1 hypothetical protein CBS147331_6671 [Penicillium roqueforti]KAI3128419.1 hypothetical protein CBS147326_6921 [Penicillium roqueforti]KAI3201939.1 hypothetical protein CBS147311_4927 [Penicillium roqueforti]